MKKYQWHSEELRKKSQLYYWLLIVCAVLALASYFIEVPNMGLWILLGCGFVCLVLSWWMRSKDAKLKGKQG